MNRAGRPKRPARFVLAALMALAAVPALPSPSLAGTVAVVPPGQSIADFYAARDGRPIWFGSSLADSSAAEALIRLLATAEADGLDPGRYSVRSLELAVAAARHGSFESIARADRMLSEALVAYTRDLRHDPATQMIWVDPELRPMPPSARDVLESLEAADSRRDFIAEMRWMNPIYAGLREAIASGDELSHDRSLLRLNLERARALPATGRYIIVNAAAARLMTFEGPNMADSMRVVVGKPNNPTPMMAAIIRYTSLNPYWYVPSDLAAERIAPNVVSQGLPYLERQGYQVMSSWDRDASIVDPATIDWKAVAAGETDIVVRQLPGPVNAMGRMKFMFPNDQGVYLHDTPQKELLEEASRLFSGGCVRLEDAPRLAQWLYGRTLRPEGESPEQVVRLEKPVPVYITYLTAMPKDGEVAHFPDVYDRDEKALARLANDRKLASR